MPPVSNSHTLTVNTLATAVSVPDTPESSSSSASSSPENGRLLLAHLLQDRHVLVAEDNEINRRVIQALLKSARLASLTVCPDGDQAVRHALEHPVDVLFMDLHMPEKDGIQATRELRAAGFTFPIIAITANVNPATRNLCMQVGFSGYLNKPIDPVSLSQTLQNIFLAPDNFTGAHVQKPSSPCCPLEIFDATGFEEAFCQDEELCREVAGAFVTQALDQIENIEAALRARDHQVLIDCYHKLNGSAHTLKAQQLAEICQRGEALARARADDEEQAEVLTSLLNAFSEVRQCLAGLYPVPRENS